MFAYICLTRTLQIHQLSLSKPDSFAFKTNINRNLFVYSLKNHDFTSRIRWYCCTSLHFIKRRGRSSPRFQAKSLHELLKLKGGFAMMMSFFDIFIIVALIACFYYKIYFCIDSLSLI